MVARLSESETKDILKQFGLVPTNSNLDTRFDSWVRYATSILQINLGITVDGIAGDQTARAAQEFKKDSYALWYGNQTQTHYYGEPKPPKFGWYIPSGSKLIHSYAPGDFAVTSHRKEQILGVLETYPWIKTDYPEWSWPLILMIIMTESGGDAGAIRHEQFDYSVGLMQILTGTAKMVGYTGDEEDLFDPKTNVALGWKYVQRNPYRHLYDPVLVCASYNAGHVRPSSKNPFGIKVYGDHIERSIRNYNAAVSVLTSKTVSEGEKVGSIRGYIRDTIINQMEVHSFLYKKTFVDSLTENIWNEIWERYERKC